MTKTSLSTLLVTLIALTIIGCVLTFVYQGLGLYFNSVTLAAAVVNLTLGMVILSRLPASVRENAWQKPPLKTLTPSAIVFIGTTILATASAYFVPPAETIQAPPMQWLFVLGVPIAEEIFFRGGVGSVLRLKLGKFSGSYISAIFFAWMHSLPSFSQLLTTPPQIFLGPLILGGLCEALFVWSGGSLIPCIILHMISNATVPLFASIDARWLEWLGMLYI